MEIIRLNKFIKKLLITIGFVLIITIFFLMHPTHHTTSPRTFEVTAKGKVTINRIPIMVHQKLNYIPQNIPDDVQLKIIAKYYPNIPLLFWKKYETKLPEMFLSNLSCAPFPDIFKLDIRNIYWQMIFMTNRTTVQVYSAYYDNREISGEVVRILSMVNRTLNNFPGKRTLYCQMWFDNEPEPVIAPMDKLEYLWIDYWNLHTDGRFGPYLLGCSIPNSHKGKIPKVVSFVEFPCDKATNMLRVVYNKPIKKREFTVCVKGLDFLQTDLSYRLIEWIELVLLMGADKIYFYKLEVHPNMQKVLDYYVNQGKIDVRDITLPTGQPNIPYFQHIFLVNHMLEQCLDEIIPYNDCFYRNIYSHDYVGIFDIDEIILPVKDKNWHDLLLRTISYDEPNLKYNGFTARHIYFLDEFQKEGPYQGIPPYMHMMQHVYRSQNFTNPGEYVKTLFSTKYTISCHNHWPISTAPGTITRDFRLDEGRVQHYRKHCSLEVNCTTFSQDPVKDTRLWHFKKFLVPRVKRAVEKIGFSESAKHFR